MGIYSNSFYSRPHARTTAKKGCTETSTKPIPQLYDLFEIINPVKGHVTCVGHAPSMGRRCWNQILAENRTIVADKLQAVDCRLALGQSVSEDLEAIAFLALCKRNHRGQARKVAMDWQRKIEELYFMTKERRELKRERHSISPKVKQDTLRIELRIEWKAEAVSEEKGEKESGRRTSEETERQRQRRERQRRKKEREMWEEAWEDYTEAWKQFKDQRSTIIPWPVESGDRRDVTESNISTFYRNAAPDQSDEAMRKLMRRECLKWHSDRLSPLLENLRLKKSERTAIALVERTVIELRAEFQEKQKKH